MKQSEGGASEEGADETAGGGSYPPPLSWASILVGSSPTRWLFFRRVEHSVEHFGEILMQNSYVHDLTSVYLGIFNDAKYAFPTLSQELVKDQQRLITLIETRGLPFLTVDLPNLGKHLDRCLSQGKYIPSGLPASRLVSARVKIPVLFRGLYLLVFDADGCLKEECDVAALFFLRQFLYCAKKASIMCCEGAILEAINSFIALEAELPVPDPWWDCGSGENSTSTTICTETFTGFRHDAMYRARADEAQVSFTSLATLDKVFGLLVASLGVYNTEDWRFKHGHGAVSNLPRSGNRYEFAGWSGALETVFPYADMAFSSHAHWADASQFYACDVDGCGEGSPSNSYPPLVLNREWGPKPASKLIAVEKTFLKPRLIASEPVENMWCQQNVRDYMYARVREGWVGNFIKFDDQTQNQSLCLEASLDGSLATIDLSEASDRVTCQAVAQAFRGNPPLLRALRAVRTQLCKVPEYGIVELRKFSTMGNACTFPVESLIFLGVALAGCLGEERFVTAENIQRLRGKVSVFGDDIIVPKDKVGAVMKLLEVLHFKVNVSKSYYEGNFRESCGVDAYRGINITPVYWRKLFDGTPESYSSSLETANNFYKRFLVTTSEAVRTSTQSGSIRFPVVPVGSCAAGFESFVTPKPFARWRRNEGLQADEFLLPVLNQVVKVDKICDATAMLQFFTELPDPFTKWESGLRGRPVLKIRHSWVSVDQFYGAKASQPFTIPNLPMSSLVARTWQVNG